MPNLIAVAAAVVSLVAGAGDGGGSSLPLRSGAANNFGPQALTTNPVNVATTVEIYARVNMVLGVDLTSITLLFPNWAFQSATGIKNPGNTIQIIETALEYNGTFKQVFFSAIGNTTGANGSNTLADPLQAAPFSVTKFSKGTQIFVRYRLRYNVPATDNMPHMGGGKGTTASYRVDPTKVNVTNGTFGTGVIAYSMINGGVNGTDAVQMFNIYMPLILGNHSVVTPVFIGDSKTYGTGDTIPGNIACGGMSRCLFSNPVDATTVVWPGINMGVPSGTALEWSTSISGADITLASALLKYCTHAVVGYGTNAFQTAQLQTLYGIIRANGITKIIQRSLTPQSTNAALAISPLVSAGTPACTGTVASTATIVDQNTYTIQLATPATYNGDYVVTVVPTTTITYTAGGTPGSSPATGTPQIIDNWRTLASQITVVGWSVGGGADTYQQTLKGWTATDANLTYYESMGERFATSGANYWFWIVTGAKQYSSSDGKHESAGGYELNIGTNGNVTTQAGGTV